jgi:hypothetical protein
MDGTGARRVRTQRRVVRLGIWFLVVVALAVVASQLPAVDPEYLLHGAGRPIMAGALLTLLGAAALLALARMHRVRD